MYLSWRSIAALLLISLVAVTTVQAGQPRFTVENAQGTVPLNVTFHDVSEVANVTARTWDFGDGQTANTTDPVHTYTVPGSYMVTLKLKTNEGEQAFQMANIVKATGMPTPTSSPVPVTLALAAVGIAVACWDRCRRAP